MLTEKWFTIPIEDNESIFLFENLKEDMFRQCMKHRGFGLIADTKVLFSLIERLLEETERKNKKYKILYGGLVEGFFKATIPPFLTGEIKEIVKLMAGEAILLAMIDVYQHIYDEDLPLPREMQGRMDTIAKMFTDRAVVSSSTIDDTVNRIRRDIDEFYGKKTDN